MISSRFPRLRTLRIPIATALVIQADTMDAGADKAAELANK